MDERIIQIAIAGLLHDIGKLEQRARIDPWKTPEGISQEGQPVHAAWTQYFCSYAVPARFRGAALAGAFHHNPEKSPAEDKSTSRLVALADKLSAGERADLPDKSKGIPRQMVTIFDRIQLDSPGLPAGSHYLPLKSLNLSLETIFPDVPTSSRIQTDAYAELVERLRKEAQSEIGSAETYLENLLSALQQQTWSVPSAYYHSVPDVSLYDHSRMTAALAVCLADRPDAEIQGLLEAVQAKFQQKASHEQEAMLQQPAVILVGGDLSGIQDFIYTISSKKAAQTLRGRSFYLQLLTEAVLRFTLNRLDLPVTNVIYSGGGHFFFLAPVACQEKLAEVRVELSRILIRHHGTALYLALDYARVPFDGFKIGAFPEYWGQMHGALARRKQQRFTELGVEMYELVFKPPEIGGNPEATCSVCGEDHRPTDKFDEHEEQARICSLCDSFAAEIGRYLPDARFISLGWEKPGASQPGRASDCLRELGMTFQFLHHGGEAVDLPQAERVTVWALDDPADNNWPKASLPTARVLRYTVNRVPQMTFDKLLDQTEGGFHRLGVLRMDVDDLGRIFKDGFGRKGDPNNRATLARLATLSFQMSLFFEGWVKRLCEEDPFAGLIYAVYAGGDDIFLIGPWDKMPALALRIREQFEKYTAGHPDLHLSGGLAFIGGKYPVYQAAEDAGDALQAAKNLPGKNAFYFVGRAWRWPVFAEIDARKERLVQLTDKIQEGAGGPKSILMLLRDLAASQQEMIRKGRKKTIWGPWIWHGMYQLTRMAERYEKNQPAAAAELSRIKTELHESHYQNVQEWGTAARWTQLLLRRQNAD